ncbi:SPL family radical SAM protein [Arcobacter sp. FWKO B]|uniref:SPL family radical SAM protein n=1 Tax=Arcobacter sp. FWKO B TaxID=2593672 RepID=UPI0018A4B45A|nr:hypothetical protein [Arcobacter sp. FWKO B]QOG12503.1 hypothetical protein FWKOB_07220 [Arcobacter sp. FWKO B]
MIENFPFSVSQKKILDTIAQDFKMWNEKSLEELFPHHLCEKYKDKELLRQIVRYYENIWNNLKNTPTNYQNFKNITYDNSRKISFVSHTNETLGFGMCPVASPKTRCCNLLTLDAVQSCGFDCSYCAIQSFYNENKIGIDSSFNEKLKTIQLDPNEIYHIGTGQSSDSLMWGNKFGTLEALFDFAKTNPNVILELKTKSDNINYLLENVVPKNVIVTWSLNPQIIIDNEEHLSASLDSRIQSALKLSRKGILVGFHFHPIVVFENYLLEYGKIYARLIKEFDPKMVALVSFGTLTFIKPVLKKLRQRGLKSKILQMPFDDANGKYSYPLELKKEMFKHAYESFKPWYKDVFFYLCMEDESLWKEVFGYEYISNNQFEEFMKEAYMKKVEGFRVKMGDMNG